MSGEWSPTDPSGACLRYTSYGIPYEEISCLYPSMGKTYMSWEYVEWLPMYEWMRDNYVWFPPLMCVIYLTGIFSGRQYFETREPFSWRNSLALWNLGLSTFSTIGFWRMLPQLMHNLYHYGLWGQLCLDPESMIGSSTTGLWCMLFVLSKIPEFGDTFFIVIHKKKLMFLHWYHHISVLLCCWHSFISKAPTGLFFGTMNYGVHSIMYFYYFLMAIRQKPKWFNPQVCFMEFLDFGCSTFFSDVCMRKNSICLILYLIHRQLSLNQPHSGLLDSKSLRCLLELSCPYWHLSLKLTKRKLAGPNPRATLLLY